MRVVIGIYIIMCLFAFSTHAQNLTKVAAVEDDYLILGLKLNDNKLRQNIDAYAYQKQLLIAIEPFFDNLDVKYQLLDKKLTIWKNEEVNTFSLVPANATNNKELVWAADGDYLYVSSVVFEQLFDIKFTQDLRRLEVNITTSQSNNPYQFPKTVKAEIERQRAIAKIATRKSSKQREIVPITIEDQYRLFTLPHGQITTQVALDNNKQNNNVNLQLVSDLLYHSANINISKSSRNDLTGGLTLSRFKTSPDDFILGAFDTYRLGDISSTLSSPLVSSNAGVGISFNRAPEGFRGANTQINLEQYAPPGWEAELYLNNQFIEQVIVPDTGLLIFKDVEIFYGNNNFSIKVYGPYGEKQEFVQVFNLNQNALNKGQMAYSFFGLDSTRSLFNNNNDLDGFEIDSLGGTFEYGISDFWQIGVGLNYQKNNVDFINNSNLLNVETDGTNQVATLKNNLNFPGFLIENEIAVNNDNKYLQQTTLSGSAFGYGSYDVSYRSGNGLLLNGRNSFLGEGQQLSARFSNSINNIRYLFAANYSEDDFAKTTLFSNTLSYSFPWLRVANTLSYLDNQILVGDESFTGNSLQGRLGLTSTINNDFRLSANINYVPNPNEGEDIIAKSSSFNAQYRLTDPFDLRHYFTLAYSPLNDLSSKWQVSHSLNWEAPSHRLILRSRYDEDDNWAFSLNFSFFFGYDYHNNRTKFSNQISTHSASLNVHSYLDRQNNGRPDVLDYALEGVGFTGIREWEGLTTGKHGKIVLPGAQVNTPFQFKAHYKTGTETINNDYVVYTHPGARLDVNMPFYLSTEIAGFVYRGANEVPVANISVELIDPKGAVVNTQKTDIDGYYEFLNIKPNQYQIRVSDKSLSDKLLTGAAIGYKFITANSGGFIELPNIMLRRLNDLNDRDSENIDLLIIEDDKQELLIFDEDEKVMNNLFTLPAKEQAVAEHDLEIALALEEESKAKKSAAEATLADKIKIDNVHMVTRNTQSVLPQINNPAANNGANTPLKYTLQLGAFSQLATAKRIVSEYDATNLLPVIKSLVNKNNKTIYRVELGEFTSTNMAKKYASQRGLSAKRYIIKVVKPETEGTLVNSQEKPVAAAARSAGNVSNSTIKVRTLAKEGALDENPFNSVTTPVSADAVNTNVVNTNNGLAVKSKSASNANLNGEWVIQLYASQAPLDDSVLNRFTPNNALLSATKSITSSNKRLYCLLSGTYTNKQQAVEELNKLSVDGWVTRTNAFSNVTALIN